MAKPHGQTRALKHFAGGLFEQRFPAEFAEVKRRENHRKGEKLIEVLGLRRNAADRIDTTWGDKTALGLYHTVKRIIEEDPS